MIKIIKIIKNTVGSNGRQYGKIVVTESDVIKKRDK